MSDKSLKEDQLVKISTEAASKFVESYYKALDATRRMVSSFYVPQQKLPDGKTVPMIVYNGNHVADASTMQDMFEKEMPPTHHEVQAFDAQVVNPNYTGKHGPTTRSASKSSNVSVVVSVSGYVRYGESRQEPLRGFSESLFIVPNMEVVKGRPKGGNDWLIQSQTFRVVV